MIEYSCSKTPLEYTVFGNEPLPHDKNFIVWWHLHNFSNDLDKFHQIAIVANAFGRWERHMWPIQFQHTKTPDKAHWHIFWVKENKIDLGFTKTDSTFDFVNNPNTLAVQYASPNLRLLINDDKNYSAATPGENTFDLELVLTHEIGHGLRLGHSQRKDLPELMLPYYDPANYITVDSVTGLHTIHKELLQQAVNTLPHSKSLLQAIGLSQDPNGLQHNKGCNFLSLLKG